MKIRTLQKLLASVTCFLCLCFHGQVYAQADIYANQLISASTDFQYPARAVDTNQTNYAYVSNLLGLLNTSYLQAGFPAAGKAGDVVNVTVQGSGQTLGLGLLTGATIRLYNAQGNQVAVATGSNVLQLSLLVNGTNTYAIRYFTNPNDTFHFTSARLELNNVLSANVLNEFRVYNFFFQQPCPPVYADGVHDSGSAHTASLLSGYVTNAYRAADSNPNNFAQLVDPLNLLGLLPNSYIDLSFSQPGHGGDYVGFTISQASSLLDLSLLNNLTAYIYSDNSNTPHETYSNFSLLNLQLLSGTTNQYTLGFVADTGNYKITRLRLALNPTVGVLNNLNVYNAFHYAINRPQVAITTSGPTSFCQGGSVTLTAHDTLGASNYLWSNGATTQSITVTQPGTYSVQVLDSSSCSRISVPVAVNIFANPSPVIIGDTVLCAGAAGSLHTSQTYTAYSWSTGASTATINITGAGKYYVSVTDSNACHGSDTVNVVNNALMITPTITKVTCSNGTTGAVALAVSGGSNHYTYRWSTGGMASSITGLGTGIYTAIIRDSVYGCSYNRAYSVTANNTLSVKSAVVNTSSCGKADGRVTLNVIGGSGNYTYSWSNGATTASLTNVAAGIYRVTATDATSGCTVADTVAVSDGGNTLTAVPVIVAATSCSVANGSIAVAVTGGSGNYTYSWSTGAVQPAITGLAAGNYYLLVKDNVAQCSRAFMFTVTNSAQLTINGTVTASACNGATGGVTATVANGSSNYTYAWSTGTTTAAIANVQSGTYILNVHDNISGCNGQHVFTVGETGAPTATLTATQPSCASNGNGSITVTAAGNNNRYTWSNGTATQNQGSLSPGTYTVTVTDTTTGCSGTYSTTLTAKPQINITAGPADNTACATAANGSITSVVTGGTAPYTYAWSTGAATANLTNVNAGNYTLNVADNNGCTASVVVPVITDSTRLLNVTLGTTTRASCNTATNGGVTITATGGTAPYTYHWSNNATTQNLTGVAPGIYTVTVTDAVGCSKQLTDTIGIDSSNAIHITVDSLHGAGCAGSVTGAIFISVTGGALPYTYSWSNGSVLPNLLNVLAGSYSVTVTDHNGCTAKDSANVPVSNSGLIAITVDSTHLATCNVSGDGSIYVHLSGGVAPYTYLWSNGATTQNLVNVNPGIYTLTVTDANGCPGQLVVTLGTDPARALTVNVDSTIGAGCATGTSAAIYTHETGGTMPYTYIWSNGTTAQNLVNVTPGIYALTVTDAKGCTAIGTLPVGIDPTRSIQATLDSVSGAGCAGSNSGDIYVSVTHGVAPYTYQWSNGGTMQNLLNVSAGAYTLTIHDAAGCTDMLNATVNVDPAKAVNVYIDSVQGPGCAMSPTGSIFTHVSGGKMPYTYSWSNGATSQNLSGVVAGTYSLTVTDANGCSATASVNLTTDPAKGIQVSATAITGAECNASATGSVAVGVAGGTLPYTYVWSNGTTMQNLQNVTPGSYTVTVTDAAGCSGQLSANVGIDTANQLTATVSAVNDAKCLNSRSGSINVNVNGGTMPYTFIWSDGSVAQNLSYVTSGSYSLNVMDAAGCSTSLSANVGIDTSNPVRLMLDSLVNVGCGDSASGQIYVSTSGGTVPYTYLWSNGSTAEDLMNVTVGSYNVTATDNNGCTATLSANVQNAAPFVISANVQDVKCYGNNDGAIDLTVTNGSGVFSYTWSNGATTADITGLSAQRYVVTVKDQLSGCSQKDSFNITQTDSLVASYTVTSDSCSLLNGGVNLAVSGGTPPYTYAWSNNTILQNLINVLSGTYSVTITDQNGCNKSLSITVAESNCDDNIIFHDVITPNGDGMNDYWVIEGIGLYPKNSVQIFDKLGDMVYQANNYNNTWNGTDTKGNPLPAGTYYYLVKLNDANRQGGKNAFTGFILVQR